MKECPQCHSVVLESDKFCKNCGCPLAQAVVQDETTQETVSAQSDEANTLPEQAAKANATKSRLPLLIALIAAVVVIGAAIGVIRSKQSERKPEVVEMPTEDAIEQISKNYGGRIFDEKLNLKEHPGLLSAEEVTGPFFEIRKEDGSFYVPDTVKDQNAGKGKLPDDVEIVEASKDSFPKEYLELLQSGKKAKQAAKGKESQVYGLMEYTGYETAGNYNNGGFILYYHTSRVSFYDLESGDMVGWMPTSETRTGPFILYTNQYESDGQHPIYKFSDETIWSDQAWTKALDELFYDENGYQVVGDRLISVPDDVDTIEVPEGVREIASSVGVSHQARELILPKGVEKIGSSAFASSSLKEITIPDSVVYCGSYAFDKTPWIDQQDDWVIVGDGVLIRCKSADKELTVPEEVHYIAPSAFDGLTCTKITIPDSVIECFGGEGTSCNAAISSLENLEELVLEGGLQDKVEGQKLAVVRYCNQLKKVTVDCKVEELPDDWMLLNNDVYKNMTVICPDDSPVAEWAEKMEVKHQEK